jgi:thiol-disulfide isomerase/thioredoxin
VGKRELHLYAAPSRWSRPVGAANPTFTVAVVPGNEGDLVNGDSLAAAATGKPKFALAAGRTSPPSVYPVTLSGLKSTNYALVYRTLGFTVYTKDIVAGETAPEVTGHDQHGATFSLSSLRGRVVLLDYSAVWCGPSNQLAREMSTIADALARKGIPFSYLPVLIDGPSPNVPGNQTNAFNYDNKYDLPVGTHVLHLDGQPAGLNQPLPGLMDSFYGFSAVATNQDGIGSYPTLAFIDPDGMVRKVSAGYDGVDALVDELSSIGPDTGVQLTSAPPAVTTKHTASIEFTTTDDAPATCSLDGGAAQPCTSPHELADLSEGDHQVEISIGASAALVIGWRVIALETTITGGPGSGFIPAFEFSGTGVSFLCWTGDEEPYYCESGWQIGQIPGGLQTFHVASVDEFGHVDDTPATQELLFQPLPTISLVPDNEHPGPTDEVIWTVTVTDAEEGYPVTGEVVFFSTASEVPTTVTLEADGTATYTEPAHALGYEVYVSYQADAAHGQTSTGVHIDIAP